MGLCDRPAGRAAGAGHRAATTAVGLAGERCAVVGMDGRADLDHRDICRIDAGSEAWLWCLYRHQHHGVDHREHRARSLRPHWFEAAYGFAAAHCGWSADDSWDLDGFEVL